MYKEVSNYISFISIEIIVLCHFLGSSYSGHYCSKISGTALRFRKLFIISPIVSFSKNNKFAILMPLAVIAIYTKTNK